MQPSVSWPVAALLIVTSGCMSSRWAMDDPEYAEKYDRPYEEGEKIPRMAKQMIDARHVAGDSGVYVSGLGAGSPMSAGGELGVFVFPPFETPWLETRAAGVVLLNSGGKAAGGLDVGARIQTPSRVAPFAGLGMLVASGHRDIFYLNEDDETVIGAVYPEVGMHCWLTSNTRLSAFGRYYVAGNTARNDVTEYWATGLALSFIVR